MISLDDIESATRQILTGVAARKAATKRSGLISYKELWERISDEKWGQARTRKVVSIITKVTAFEIERGRPPLNEIVVQTQKGEPREEWKSIRNYLKKTWGVVAPYGSHREAQTACWEYWASADRGLNNQYLDSSGENGTDEAEEGFRQDRTAVFRKRNAALIARRKLIDAYTCQACGFRLKVRENYLIDCHHINPLGMTDAPVITKLDKLVCLCPTCHRISHTRRDPLSVSEIKKLRSHL